ncbi:MAG: hypothetical protein M1546_18555 [Chloroflexi bacterium]|nr:hypothetical protein [Chloroflexota bacterium]
MNFGALTGNRTLRTAMIVVGISLIAGLAAIFVFKVDPGTVLTFGLFGLFMASHLFMHGGHGGHEDHSQHTQSGNQTTGADHAQHTQPADQTTEAASKAEKNKQTEHSGCH